MTLAASSLGMLHLFIDLNEGCNLKCAMCGPRAGLADQRVLDFKTFESRVAPIFARVADFQLGCACEPLMLPYLPKALELIRRHLPPGRFGQIITNGTLLKPQTSALLLESGIFSKIRISVDGATAPTFEAIRKGARFDKVMANIASLCDLRTKGGHSAKIEINFTILRENHMELPRLILLAGKMGVDGVTTHKLAPGDLCHVDEDFKRQVDESQRLALETALLAGVEFERQTYRNRAEYEAWPRSRCMAPRNGFRLDPQGVLYPQCHAAQKNGPLGGLAEHDIDTLLASPQFGRYLACIDHPHPAQCANCTYFGGP